MSLYGATNELYTEDKQTLLDKKKNTEKSHSIFENYDPGDYYVRTKFEDEVTAFNKVTVKAGETSGALTTIQIRDESYINNNNKRYAALKFGGWIKDDRHVGIKNVKVKLYDVTNDKYLTRTLETNEFGVFKFKGLSYRRNYIVEYETPEGYNSEPIYNSISPFTSEDGSFFLTWNLTNAYSTAMYTREK